MTTREKAQKLLDELPEDELEPIVEILASRGKNGPASQMRAKKSKKPGRLSFFAIGAGDQPDASNRVDELLGLSINRRHPAERHDLTEIATLDHRHFGVVRPRHTESFTLLP
jgi:hypothetical protein